MKLRDLSRRIREEDRPDISFALQGGMELSDINTDWLADFPETVYIANSQSVIFGKVQKETLLYLIARQREFQFRQILDSMNDGVIAVDETGRIFYANPAYVSILGVKVPSLTIPVKPGRNLAVILEVAAMNNRQKKMGYNAAQELYRTLEYLNKQEGIAIVAVTHDIRSALRYADHILHAGHGTYFFGTAADYLTSPWGKRFGGDEA